MSIDFERTSLQYSAAIEGGSSVDAERVVRAALEGGATGPEVFARVLTPAMYRIGERWERAEITAADEHLATAISNRVMGSVYDVLAREIPTSRPRIVIAAVEGDQHVMGLRMIADILEGAGYETLYLGADTPTEGLISTIAKYGPKAVAVGATAPWSGAKLVETIRAIRAAEPALPIVLGGAQAAAAAVTAGDDLVSVAASAETAVAVVEAAIGRARSAGAAS